MMKMSTTKLIVVAANSLTRMLLFIPVRVLYLSNSASFFKNVLIAKFMNETNIDTRIVRKVHPMYCRTHESQTVTL